MPIAEGSTIICRAGRREPDRTHDPGQITAASSKLRKGDRHPGFLEPRRTADNPLVTVIEQAAACPELEPGIHGVSTRSVDDLVKTKNAGGMSKSKASRP